MASFGGVPLGDEGAAVFAVTPAADGREFCYPDPNGSQVVIPASSEYLVVRHCAGTSFDDVFDAARKAANRALDIYFGSGGGRPLVLAHTSSAYLVVWAGRRGQTARVVGRHPVTVRASGTVTEMRDADGNRIALAKSAPKQWHDCLRYYRISEFSSDLFDSFRNLYLAIEALLSVQVPPKSRREGDSAWFEQALCEIGKTIALDTYAPRPSNEPHCLIHQELYKELRTAIFHAKQGRPIWMPRDCSSRAKITEARVRYARMFRELARHYLDIAYPGGGFAESAWDRTWGVLLSPGNQIFVSSNPALEDEPGESQAVPSGGSDHVLLASAPADGLLRDKQRGLLGVKSAATVHESIGAVRRFEMLYDGKLSYADSLQAPFTVDGLAELQVAILGEGRNYGQPREDFES